MSTANRHPRGSSAHDAPRSRAVRGLREQGGLLGWSILIVAFAAALVVLASGG